VRVLYYDPIHDYGFLKFDPKDVKRTTVTELRLRPDLAEVGQTIRVIGNDAGQKLNISEGIISRLNRNPPEYSGYRDFNINYIQGSAMTSGGSSGSPVIEAGGNVVALNGGSVNGAAVALFLPVEHPLKTLHHLIEDEVVPRGTLQAKWTHEAFHKCQNLGLPDSWVTTVQQIIPDETGMLVIKSVLPEGPADSILEEGDVILKVNGKLVTKFSQITKFLDCNVLKDISMTVQRWDKEIEVTVVVGDLHDITPNRYLMIGTTTFYDLSYQQAQRYRIPVRGSGVVSSEDGLFGTVPGDSMIQSVNGRKTKDLDAFVEVLQSIPGKFSKPLFCFGGCTMFSESYTPCLYRETTRNTISVLIHESPLDGTHLLVATKGFDDINKLEYNICILERGLYRMELASREPNSGSWQFADIITPPAIASTTPQKAALAKPSHPKYADAAYILHALVFVTTLYPLGVDGVTDSGKSGYGLIVNEELGLVLVSRQTIRSEFCTIQIRFHASIVVPGRVVFAHPTESFAVVKYDTSLVDAPVVRARLSSTETELGESGLLFYINTGWRLLLSSTAVAGKCVVTTDPDMQNSVSAVNSEVLTVGQSPGNYSGSGLISEDGTVQALYLGDYLTTVASIIPVLKQLEAGEVPQTRLLGARLDTTSLLQAITMGLPEGM
jgi:S1-C subfamily serine protease